MRSILRPVVVAVAAVGLSLAGVTAATACGHHHSEANGNFSPSGASQNIMFGDQNNDINHW